ncbi:FtsK/SpoIIIE domain-containing protein [Ectobacillus ponti]|uniref:FtsK/SpoIIIE domain-containing protein n=1 Tax=Ectobacillus ponti TaxID=2961894 RepID=A0AA42BR51_9BACI|nr:FtsK/SpoIIIE domain-containing protein [Ectobacillus ponti]MCP8970587.1 FtsK/SpoIIIE domain-containing protein [Ectobacillus ponti]
MFELLLVPAAALVLAMHGDKLKKKQDDKEKIKVFFEVAGIAIKRDDKLQYPTWEETKRDDRSTTYVYKLPLGMPSKVIQKVEEIVGEGLGKPVKITYDNYLLRIRVFSRHIPERWNWTPELVEPGKWRVPMGQGLDQLYWHDFDKIPHLTAGGLTRMGKTVFLKVLTTTIIESQPEHAHFFVIDLKGGLEFGRYRHLKQVKGIAETPEEAFLTLQYIVGLMIEKMELMKAQHLSNVVESNMPGRIFVIVDEGAELCPGKGMPAKKKKMLEGCQEMLSHIARIGGALGVRLVFCTQYPTGDTLPRQVKQNADAKLGFRLPTQVASQVVLDEPGLEQLPTLPGRALFKTDHIVELQVPYISDQQMWDILKKHEVKPSEPVKAAENRTADEDFDLD